VLDEKQKFTERAFSSPHFLYLGHFCPKAWLHFLHSSQPTPSYPKRVYKLDFCFVFSKIPIERTLVDVVMLCFTSVLYIMAFCVVWHYCKSATQTIKHTWGCKKQSLFNGHAIILSINSILSCLPGRSSLLDIRQDRPFFLSCSSLWMLCKPFC